MRAMSGILLLAIKRSIQPTYVTMRQHIHATVSVRTRRIVKENTRKQDTVRLTMKAGQIRSLFGLRFSEQIG